MNMQILVGFLAGILYSSSVLAGPDEIVISYPPVVAAPSTAFSGAPIGTLSASDATLPAWARIQDAFTAGTISSLAAVAERIPAALDPQALREPFCKRCCTFGVKFKSVFLVGLAGAITSSIYLVNENEFVVPRALLYVSFFGSLALVTVSASVLMYRHIYSINARFQ